jgi:hypothetical protein
MKIRVYIICLVILLLFSGHPGLAQNPRDLTHYDDGGAFDLGWAGRPDADAKMRPKLRDFLWEHWTQKHLAHVVVTFYTIEGDPMTYNLFVEPDRDRRWRVVAEYESECCWYYAMEKPKRKRKREKGAVIYDVVERVQASGSGQAPLSLTPEGNPREANSYILRLRQIVDGNKSGGELIF